MQSYLVLNTPWQGTGNRSDWWFSGADDRALRACLDQLDEFFAPDPGDRWTAALGFGFHDTNTTRVGRLSQPERAWTIDGAMKLAELLPDTLADLRNELVRLFAPRVDGWLGDAHTPPRATSD